MFDWVNTNILSHYFSLRKKFALVIDYSLKSSCIASTFYIFRSLFDYVIFTFWQCSKTFVQLLIFEYFMNTYFCKTKTIFFVVIIKTYSSSIFIVVSNLFAMNLPTDFNKKKLFRTFQNKKKKRPATRRVW